MSDTASLCSEDVANLSVTNWDTIQQSVSSTLHAISTYWGENNLVLSILVRFLRVERHVPLKPGQRPGDETTIPLPGIICYNASSEEAGVVTTMAEGIALVDIYPMSGAT